MTDQSIENRLLAPRRPAGRRTGRGRMKKGQVTRFLRTLHGWLGMFIFPWIIIIGLTGFYLNHWQAVLNILNGPAYDESQFDEWPVSEPVTVEKARAVALSVWPDEPILQERNVTYHKRKGFEFRKKSGRIIVSRPTGHYFVKTRYRRLTYAPDGTLLHSKFYWGPLFKRLHETGWVDRSLGTWLADLTSLAMVVFGLSGITIWLTPRLRRLRRLIGGAR